MIDGLLSLWHATGAPEPVRFAASELSTYLGPMTGQRVDVSEAADDSWPMLEL
jgi:hypothetical protein